MGGNGRFSMRQQNPNITERYLKKFGHTGVRETLEGLSPGNQPGDTDTVAYSYSTACFTEIGQ